MRTLTSFLRRRFASLPVNLWKVARLWPNLARSRHNWALSIELGPIRPTLAEFLANLGPGPGFGQVWAILTEQDPILAEVGPELD